MTRREVRKEPDLSFEEQQYANAIAELEPWYVTIYEGDGGKVEVESNLGDNNEVIAMIAKAQLVALVQGAKLFDEPEPPAMVAA